MTKQTFSREIRKHQIQHLCKNTSLPQFCIQFGSFPPGRGMFRVTEAGHANLCGVVGCFRGERPPSRQAEAPEQSQRDLRRPLAQPRQCAAPPKKSRPSQNPVFHSSLAPTPHEHKPGYDFAQKFDRCIPVAAVRFLGIRGCASPPKRSQ